MYLEDLVLISINSNYRFFLSNGRSCGYMRTDMIQAITAGIVN